MFDLRLEFYIFSKLIVMGRNEIKDFPNLKGAIPVKVTFEVRNVLLVVFLVSSTKVFLPVFLPTSLFVKII